MKILFSLLLITAAFVASAQTVEESVRAINFDASDSTVFIEFRVEVTTSSGLDFVKDITSRKFELFGVPADIDSLNNNPLADDVLTKLGAVLSNKFPNN